MDSEDELVLTISDDSSGDETEKDVTPPGILGNTSSTTSSAETAPAPVDSEMLASDSAKKALTPVELAPIFSKCANCEKTVYFGQGRLLDCFHVACTDCIKDRHRRDLTLVCPKCCQRTSVHRYYSDVFHNSMPTVGLAVNQRRGTGGAELLAANHCEDCMDVEKRREAATCWCADCEVNYCKEHGQQHSQRRLSKRHTIVGLKRKAEDSAGRCCDSLPQPAVTDAIASSCSTDATDLMMAFTSSCSLHPKEQLRYCPECGDLLCAVCQETGGCTHNTVDADEAVKHCLPELAALVKSPDSESEQATPGQREALSAVEKQIRSIDDDVSRISEAVTTTFDKYKKALEDKMNEILNDLDEIKWKNRIPLEDQRQRLQDLGELQRRAYQFTSMFKQPANSLDPLVMLRMSSALMHVARATSQTYAEEPKRRPRLAFIQRDQEQLSKRMWSLTKTMGYAADLETYPAHFNTKLTYLQEAKHVGEETVVSIETVDDKDRPVEIGSHGNKVEDWTVSFNFPEEQGQRPVPSDDGQDQNTAASEDPRYPGRLIARCRNQGSPGVFSVTAMYKMTSVQNSLKGEMRHNFRFDPKKSSKLLEISDDGYSVTCDQVSDNEDVYAVGLGSYLPGSYEWEVEAKALWCGGGMSRNCGLSIGVTTCNGFKSVHRHFIERSGRTSLAWGMSRCPDGFFIEAYNGEDVIAKFKLAAEEGPFSPAVKLLGGPLGIKAVEEAD